MRFNHFGRVAAIALLASSISITAEAAKPKRPAATATAKKKAAAAAAAAAKKESDRLAALAAAKAAEEARIRAQWGVLADIGDSDFEYKNVPVTFRRSADGNSIDVTSWGSWGRGSSRITRDPATGVLTQYQVEPKGGSIVLKALADRSLEATDANGVRWPVFKLLDGGALQMMASASQPLQMKPMVAGGKAAAKLAKLVAARKVEALDAPQRSADGSSAGTGAAPVTAATTTAIASGEIVEGTAEQGGFWEWPWKKSCHPVKAQAGQAFRVDTQMFGDRSVLELAKGCEFGAETVIIKDNAGERGNLSMRFTQRTDPLFVRVWKRGGGKKFKVQMTPLNEQEVAEWKREQEEARQAEIRAKQAKASSGNSGWLGGLIMGGVAAAAGADANVVMAATAQGVAMTTDDENMRQTMTGISGDFMRNKAEIDGQKAELERLRVAAAEETRRKQEAAAAAENARRVKEANDRQQAIADAYAAKRAADDAAAADKVASDAAAKAERAKRIAEQEKRDAEAKAAEAEALAKAEREKREAAAAAETEKKKRDYEARMAELKRKQEEANRPIEWKEGIVLCSKQRENYYRCEGPLQTTYSDLKSTAGLASIGDACGLNSSRGSARDMGSVASFRVFGCGYGIHPTSDYPGNTDVPKKYGLYIDGRASFYCPRSRDAYCRGS